jgi:putative FmdB family regulatory protein
MPIYVYECEPCKSTVEELQPVGTSELECSTCGKAMSKRLTSPGMVKINRQHPSFRRRYLGTAPYTTRDTSGERVKGGLGAKGRRANTEAQKWLSSIR